MDKKLCRKCNLEKDIILFHKDSSKKDGYRNSCKECQKTYSSDFYLKNKNKMCDYSNEYYKNISNDPLYKSKRKKYMSLYTLLNKSDKRDYNKKYNIENREKIRENKKSYRLNNIEKISKYRIDNKLRKKEYLLKYIKNRLENDSLFYISFKIRNLIRISINKRGYSKKSKTKDILGCSFDDFRLYIESKFEPWMNWKNHGLYNGQFNYGWDIDHIIPISSAKSESEIIKLNHFTNLQPLCSYINRVIKRDK